MHTHTHVRDCTHYQEVVGEKMSVYTYVDMQLLLCANEKL